VGRVRLAAVVVGAALALWSAAGAFAAVAPDRRNGPSESAFVARVNAARSAVGLGALTVRTDLVDVARRHSADMAAQQRLYHNPALSSEVTGWQRVGENVGTGADVASVHDAFMHSQVHRDDILSPYFTEIGVGVVWDGSTLWVTQVFRQPAPATASARPAAAPAPAPTPTAAPAPARRTQAVRPQPALPPRPPAPAPVPVTTPPTTIAAVTDPPTQSEFSASAGSGTPSVSEDARRAPVVLGAMREQAIAVPASVPRIPAPVGLAAGLLALVTALQGVVVRRLGLA
jgi:hypothetical protein